MEWEVFTWKDSHDSKIRPRSSFQLCVMFKYTFIYILHMYQCTRCIYVYFILLCLLSLVQRWTMNMFMKTLWREPIGGIFLHPFYWNWLKIPYMDVFISLWLVFVINIRRYVSLTWGTLFLYGHSRSISWLLRPWIAPGHQQSLYWL